MVWAIVSIVTSLFPKVPRENIQNTLSSEFNNLINCVCAKTLGSIHNHRYYSEPCCYLNMSIWKEKSWETSLSIYLLLKMRFLCLCVDFLITLVCSKTSNFFQFSFGRIKRKRRNNSRPSVISNRSVMWFLTFLQYW